jgi:hypothetical protein
VRNFLLVLVVVFGCAVVLEVILENYRLVDSIGWWYTAIVAAVYTIVIMPVIGVVWLLVRKLRRRSGGSSP